MEPVDKEFLKENGLEIVKALGSGGYGTVYLVKSQKYNQEFALKQIHKQINITQESEMLSRLDCPNIVRLYGTYTFGNCKYLLEEYCPKTIQDEINDKKHFKKYEIVFFMKGVLNALDFCHSHNISHGDIKPSNFLIDNYGRIKLCDFGLSIGHIDSQLCDNYSGSLCFMAPEVLAKKPYNRFLSDMWSFGVAFYMIITRQVPWRGNSKKQLVQSIAFDKIHLGIIKDHQLASIIEKCLQRDPTKRPSPGELLKHPLFQLSEPISKTLLVTSKKNGTYSKFSRCLIKKPIITTSRSTPKI